MERRLWSDFSSKARYLTEEELFLATEASLVNMGVKRNLDGRTIARKGTEKGKRPYFWNEYQIHSRSQKCDPMIWMMRMEMEWQSGCIPDRTAECVVWREISIVLVDFASLH